MGTGIIVCGLNGSGKSTLGRALAKELGFHFIDHEDLSFSKIDSQYIYASLRSHKEVEKCLMDAIEAHNHFVYAAVKGSSEKQFLSCCRCAVLLDAPKDIRLQRVKSRSFQMFEKRILPGGDL